MDYCKGSINHVSIVNGIPQPTISFLLEADTQNIFITFEFILMCYWINNNCAIIFLMNINPHYYIRVQEIFGYKGMYLCQKGWKLLIYTNILNGFGLSHFYLLFLVILISCVLGNSYSFNYFIPLSPKLCSHVLQNTAPVNYGPPVQQCILQDYKGAKKFLLPGDVIATVAVIAQCITHAHTHTVPNTWQL